MYISPNEIFEHMNTSFTSQITWLYHAHHKSQEYIMQISLCDNNYTYELMNILWKSEIIRIYDTN